VSEKPKHSFVVKSLKKVDMFVLSKLMSAITQPVFWLAVWWGMALVMLSVFPTWRRAAVRMLWGGLVVLGLLGFEALPHSLLRPLENRYPVPPPEAVGRHAGVIVLGGATQHPSIYMARGQVPLGEAAERMSVPVALMLKHPQMQLVFSGGEGRLLATGVSEAELAKAFYEEQGVDMGRVKLEAGSRTTRENALQVAALLGERCQQPWLLVTSAWHMPRSVPEFEAVGCKVTAYPVDFRTGDATAWTEYSLARSLMLWQTALHEWLGLGVYRVTR
jgi:uncharacterized SAM-binding protein YcdF (DUF218 family)